MKGTPTTFWGKLERDQADVVTEWHPLPAHCADVAACAEALLQQTILRRRLAALAGLDDLDDVDVARLAALAALHDIGKFNLGFQRKGDAVQRDTAGHVAEVLAIVGSRYPEEDRLVEALPLGEIAEWYAGDVTELLVAAIGHHGRPVRCGEKILDRSLWGRVGALDPFAGMAALAQAVRSWFPTAFTPHRPLPDSPALQHGFAGLVMLADWLGSDRAHFPFADDLGDRMPLARRKARDVLQDIGVDVVLTRASLGGEVPGFNLISEYAPREAQARTMDLDRPPEGGLTILESETGSGKTEAALGRFIQLFHAGLVDGMVFALPTRTAATQLCERVLQAMKRAFPHPDVRPPVVLAVPGYLQVDDAHGKRLPGFEVLWNDDPRARARHIGWPAETPKRYLAAAVAVGTIDQVLLSSLRVGHAHLRATALLRHLLVVDEVHASDVYMNRILEEVLRFHLMAGGHAFLMSATLGTHVRGRLERAALGLSSRASSLDTALATPYPVVHHAARCASPRMTSIKEPGLPKHVHVTLDAIADDPAAIARRALDAARAGARVLVIRNTVNDAVSTQNELEGICEPRDEPLMFRVGEVRTLHHARFSRDDRQRLDGAIEACFGKSAPTHGGVIAIATQTVQQSLDLDADLLFTDLAPMDVLLQRFGRVHRHPPRNPHRPPGFTAARAVIMLSDSPLEASILQSGEARGKHGAGTVYDDVLILEATRRRIEHDSTLKIPEQNRELVEVTTHPEALDKLAHDLGETWMRHRSKVFGIERAHVGLATLNLVNREERFGDYSFKQSELEERIAARLGESDRRAVFATPPEGPFGAKVRELTIPGWLAREVPTEPPDLAPSDVRLDGERVRFAFGPLEFVYDRLGLRREAAGARDTTEDTADA